MLTIAVLVCTKYMEIGITDESMHKNKKHKELIESYEVRHHRVSAFMQAINPNIHYVFLRLVEPYANTKTSKDLHVIVVSEETLPAGTIINDARRAASLPPLDVVCISYVPPPSSLVGDRLSSTALREMDAAKHQASL